MKYMNAFSWSQCKSITDWAEVSMDENLQALSFLKGKHHYPFVAYFPRVLSAHLHIHI